MTTFDLNADKFPSFSEPSFLVRLVGDDKVDGSFKHILKMSDFEGQPRFDRVVLEDGEPTEYNMSEYIRLFFIATVPGYETDLDIAERIDNNIGTLVGEGGKVSFYAPSIFKNSEGLPSLIIGGKDTKAGIEPYEVPLSFKESAYTLPMDGMMSPSIVLEDLKGDNITYKTAFYTFGKLSGEGDDQEKHIYRIRVSLAKDKNDKTNVRVAKTLNNRWHQKKLNFDDVLGVQGGDRYVKAKSNHIFSRFFEANLLRSFVFPIVGIEKVVRTKKEGGEFKQLEVYVDFSDYPDWLVIALDFSDRDNVKSKLVPLNEVNVIQFDYGSDSGQKHTTMAQAFLGAEGELYPMPSVDQPWYCSFNEPPKKAKNNPSWNVWTDYVPQSKLALMEACKNIGYIAADKIAKLQAKAIDLEEVETEAIDVEVDTSSDEM